MSSEAKEARREPASAPGGRSPAPPWASGIVTGVETAVLSAGLVYAFVFAATAAAPSADGSISADWSGAWDTGTSIWLLAHGVPVISGDVTVTLVPLGLTLVTGIIAASVAKRVAVPTRSSVAWAALAYGTIAAVVSAGAHGGAAAGWTAGLVGGMVVGAGASFGLARVHDFRFLGRPRLPDVVLAGIRLGAGLGALCLAAGAAQAVIWTVAGADRIAGVVEDLSPDVAGGLTLAVGETAYLPNLSVWGLSWLTGTGFEFGTGTRYAPGEVNAGPLPDVPLIASLPGGPWAWPLTGIVVLVGLGAIARVAARRWLPPGWGGGATQVVAAGLAGFLCAGSAVLASGSAGGETLAEIGSDPVAVAWRVAVWTGLGLALASAVFRGTDQVRERTRRPRERESPSPQAAPPRPPETPDSIDPLRLW